jgi:hypothetical protein
MKDAALLNATVIDEFYLRRLERFARIANGLAGAVLPEMRRLAGHATLTCGSRKCRTRRRLGSTTIMTRDDRLHPPAR